MSNLFRQFKVCLRTQAGFSMLEVVIGGALVMGIGVFSLVSVNSETQQQRVTNLSSELDTIHNVMTRVYSSEKNCIAALSSYSSTPPKVSTGSIDYESIILKSLEPTHQNRESGRGNYTSPGSTDVTSNSLSTDGLQFCKTTSTTSNTGITDQTKINSDASNTTCTSAETQVFLAPKQTVGASGTYKFGGAFLEINDQEFGGKIVKAKIHFGYYYPTKSASHSSGFRVAMKSVPVVLKFGVDKKLESCQGTAATLATNLSDLACDNLNLVDQDCKPKASLINDCPTGTNASGFQANPSSICKVPVMVEAPGDLIDSTAQDCAGRKTISFSTSGKKSIVCSI